LNDTPLASFVTILKAPNNRTEGLIYKGTHLSRIEMGFTPVGDSVFKDLEIVYFDKLFDSSAKGDSVLFYEFSIKNLSLKEGSVSGN